MKLCPPRHPSGPLVKRRLEIVEETTPDALMHHFALSDAFSAYEIIVV